MADLTRKQLDEINRKRLDQGKKILTMDQATRLLSRRPHSSSSYSRTVGQTTSHHDDDMMDYLIAQQIINSGSDSSGSGNSGTSSDSGSMISGGVDSYTSDSGSSSCDTSSDCGSSGGDF